MGDYLWSVGVLGRDVQLEVGIADGSSTEILLTMAEGDALLRALVGAMSEIAKRDEEPATNSATTQS